MTSNSCFILKDDRGQIVQAGTMSHIYDFLIQGNTYRTSRFFTICNFNSEPIKTITSRG